MDDAEEPEDFAYFLSGAAMIDLAGLSDAERAGAIAAALAGKAGSEPVAAA
jgi:hypothetical protein